MKSGFALFAVLFGYASVGTQAAYLQQTPMAQVASLLMEMKARIESDGKVEQMSYDKYACWCEDTLGRKAKDISKSKEDIGALGVLVKKLEGEIGSHGAEIQQLEKDIAANTESQSEANAVRRKDREEYEGEKAETEQCIGALEAAVKVLTGAGTGKGFLETMKEAQLLSVVAEVRGVLERPSVAKRVNSKDLQLVRQFVAHPDDFVGDRGGFLSAVQTSNNPFGDYAPQSTQIQGILKGMYDAFTSDLEKGNADEADAQKAHEALMATKKQELETLQATLESQEFDHATKTNSKAESNERLDDTNVQLAADEELFSNVKSGCQSKASEWAERTRLRTEELAGVQQAVGILTDEDSLKVFTNSTTTFLQLDADTQDKNAHINAYAKMAQLAQRFHSFGLAQLAVDLKSGGHFDKVIASIDQMIADLRKEEQHDIDHRDRCERATAKNENEKEDLSHAIQKASDSIGSLEGEEHRLQGEVGTLEDEIARTKQEIKEALEMRNDAVSEFRQALTDDVAAVALLERTIAALTRFYQANKIPMALVSEEPTYTQDADKAPSTSWSGSYGGRSGETHGVVAIIQMIKDDVEKEVGTLRKDNAKSQAQYEKERAAMQQTMDSQLALKLGTEKELVNVEKQLNDVKGVRSAKETDSQAEDRLTSGLDLDCSWVSSHFDSRREKRQTEVQGLVDAKGFLAGVADGV